MYWHVTTHPLSDVISENFAWLTICLVFLKKFCCKVVVQNYARRMEMD